MQENSEGDRQAGKLRPPGGGKNPCDKGLFATIIRELHEEFDLDPLQVKKKLKFLGWTYQKPFWGTGVFELNHHGLKPGTYQASNDPEEKVKLVVSDLDDPDYVGPYPHRLLSDAAKERGDALMKESSFERPIIVCPVDDEQEKSATQVTPQVTPQVFPPLTGPEAIAYALNNIDLDKEEESAHAEIKRGLKTKRGPAVKKLGFIQGFRRTGVHPGDLMLHNVPVIPPQFRPYSIAGDVFIPGDANELYRDLINMVGVHKELESKLGAGGAAANKLRLYDATRAVYGFGDPTSPKTRERGVSGFLQKITGSNPKFSTLNRKLLSRNMDFVGRGVVAVDPDLGLDEVSIPEEMAWKIYAPHIQRRLVRSGMSREDAVRAIRDKNEHAKKVLVAETKERPVIYSRSPSWHKFNVVGGFPRLIEGNTILTNALVGTGQGMDYDGDQINVHVPALPDAVDDVKNKLMPSKMLFSIKNRDTVMPTPKHEMVWGLHSAQNRPSSRSPISFPDSQSALSAIQNGSVRLSDDVQIGKPKPVKV